VGRLANRSCDVRERLPTLERRKLGFQAKTVLGGVMEVKGAVRDGQMVKRIEMKKEQRIFEESKKIKEQILDSKCQQMVQFEKQFGAKLKAGCLNYVMEKVGILREEGLDGKHEYKVKNVFFQSRKKN
jgi:hypothetical protein